MEEPLKIAVCLVGQTRTATASCHNIKNYLGHLTDQCDLYIHSWDIDTPAPGVEILNTDLLYINTTLQAKVNYRNFVKIKHVYNPKVFRVDQYVYDAEYPYPGFYLSLENALSMFDNSLYDIVVVIRPDLVIDTTKKLSDDIELLYNSDFVFTNSDGRTDRVDSALWVFKSQVTDHIKMFCKQLYDNTDSTLDDQVWLMNWLNESNVKLRHPHNSNIWIYRSYHLRDKIAPTWIDVKYYDFKKMMKKI